jgi:hypothetical protein
MLSSRAFNYMFVICAVALGASSYAPLDAAIVVVEGAVKAGDGEVGFPMLVNGIPKGVPCLVRKDM